MATPDDVRRIALSLPAVSEGSGPMEFSVLNRTKQKGFAWSWKERVDPKKARVPNLGVLALRVGGADEKAQLLAADPEKFFTEPHYNGFPAVLVRLEAVDAAELRELLTDAWLCQAPAALRAALLASTDDPDD
jgi:hypothetical protein